MAKTPSRTPLIAAIIMVLLILAGFNALAEKYRPKSEHEMEAEAKTQQAEAAKNDAGKTSATPAPDSAAPQGGSSPEASAALMQLGPDKTLGAKGAKKIITVGWSWTPDVQGNPNKVWAGISALQKAAPDAQIRVVNTDAVPDVPDGVSVNGVVVIPPVPDGSLRSVPEAYKSVVEAAGSGK